MRQSRFVLPLSLLMALLAAMVIATRPAGGGDGLAADTSGSAPYTNTYGYDNQSEREFCWGAEEPPYGSERSWSGDADSSYFSDDQDAEEDDGDADDPSYDSSYHDEPALVYCPDRDVAASEDAGDDADTVQIDDEASLADDAGADDASQTALDYCGEEDGSIESEHFNGAWDDLADDVPDETPAEGRFFATGNPAGMADEVPTPARNREPASLDLAGEGDASYGELDDVSAEGDAELSSASDDTPYADMMDDDDRYDDQEESPGDAEDSSSYEEPSSDEDSWNGEDAYGEDAYEEDGNGEDAYEEPSSDEDSWNDEDAYDEDAYEEDGNGEDAYEEDTYDEGGNDEDAYEEDGNGEDAYEEDGNGEDAYDKMAYSPSTDSEYSQSEYSESAEEEAAADQYEPDEAEEQWEDDSTSQNSQEEDEAAYQSDEDVCSDQPEAAANGGSGCRQNSAPRLLADNALLFRLAKAWTLGSLGGLESGFRGVAQRLVATQWQAWGTLVMFVEAANRSDSDVQ